MEYDDARMAHVSLKSSIDASALLEAENKAAEEIK